jgi:hypothetical protein
MKVKVFFLMCVGMFFLCSCGNDGNESATEADPATEALYMAGLETDVPESGSASESVGNVNIVFTGSDIESFNLTTREIVFTENINIDELKVRVGLFSTLTLYLNQEPLFDSIRIGLEIAGYLHNDLTLAIRDSKFYLSDGYPVIEDWESLTWSNKDEVRKIREENARNRKPAWDKFIAYLTDAGKILTDSSPDTPDGQDPAPDISGEQDSLPPVLNSAVNARKD